MHIAILAFFSRIRICCNLLPSRTLASNYRNWNEYRKKYIYIRFPWPELKSFYIEFHRRAYCLVLFHPHCLFTTHEQLLPADVRDIFSGIIYLSGIHNANGIQCDIGTLITSEWVSPNAAFNNWFRMITIHLDFVCQTVYYYYYVAVVWMQTWRNTNSQIELQKFETTLELLSTNWSMWPLLPLFIVPPPVPYFSLALYLIQRQFILSIIDFYLVASCHWYIYISTVRRMPMRSCIVIPRSQSTAYSIHIETLYVSMCKWDHVIMIIIAY